MKNIRIAFDVDGTIITNANGLGAERLNVDVYNLMVLLSQMKNVDIIVWSGGGAEYAAQIVHKYGLSKYVSNCFSKQDYDDSIVDKVDIAFDDEHEFSMADKNLIIRLK